MRSKEFIAAISAGIHRPEQEAVTEVAKLVKALLTAVTSQSQVEVPGVGSFCIEKRSEYIAVKEGEQLSRLMPPSLVLEFRSAICLDIDAIKSRPCQAIVQTLVQSQGMQQAEAGRLAAEFFETLVQGVRQDRYVHVDGLGTFRQDVPAVRAGEHGTFGKSHHFLQFIPDEEVRRLVNKPFEHFESVALKEGVVLPDVEVRVLPATGDVFPAEPVEVLQTASVSEQDVLPEPPKAVAEVGEASAVEAPRADAEQAATSETVTTELLQTPPETLLAAEGPASEVYRETNEEQEFVSPLIPDTSLEPASKQSFDPWKTSKLSHENREMPEEVPQKASYKGLASLIILVALICAAVILYVYAPWGERSEALEPPTQVEEQTAPVPTDEQALPLESGEAETAEVPAETEAVQPGQVKTTEKEAPAVSEATVAVDKEGKTTEALKDQVQEEKSTPTVAPKANEGKEVLKSAVQKKYSASAKYKIVGTKAMHKISRGDNLTKIAVRYYGVKELAGYILQYNKSVIKNADNIPLGATIKIPELEAL